ncbi:MAG TPA: hypothetical protein VFW02_02695 [Candidatus Limnocylindrales bacterium]|nr:hypothetical protein [Candidatus Limnocylindrales bacterium]
MSLHRWSPLATRVISLSRSAAVGIAVALLVAACKSGGSSGY